MRKTLDEKMAEARKHLEPVRRSLSFVFSTPPGQEVIAVLERTFLDVNPPKDSTGAIDPNAVLIEYGSRQVIDFIRRFAEKEGQGE